MAPPNKRPGPDGFTNEFYKFCQKELKDELLQLFAKLHDKTVQLQGVNLDNVTLLPKCPNPLYITDYRPVWLQHSIPKLIDKEELRT